MDKRDEQLNRSILTHVRLIAVRNGGWATASALLAAASDRDGRGVDSEQHFGRLLTFLLEQELLLEKAREPFGDRQGDLRHRRLQLTDLGYRLWAGQIDPIPGVADRRAE